MIVGIKSRDQSEYYEKMGIHVKEQEVYYEEGGFFLQDVIFYQMSEDSILIELRTGRELTISKTDQNCEILRNHFSKK